MSHMSAHRTIFALVLQLVIIIFGTLIQPANAATFSFAVGALGDEGSAHNIGVRVEIRMHIYEVGSDQDSFWVADLLDNRAFIQFGYLLNPPGNYCKTTEVGTGIPLSCPGGYLTVNGSEPLWFWEYWPDQNGDRFFYGLGTFGSDALNGTWHAYSIVPISHGGWGFKLDGIQVSIANFTATHSSDRAYAAAEKTTELDQSFTTTQPIAPGQLGPVEFRNLSYLTQDGWHSVTALYVLVNCGVNQNCPHIPYGVSSDGPNHIIAGTSIPERVKGDLLWNSQSAPSQQQSATYTTLALSSAVAAAAAAVIFAGFYFWKKHKLKREAKS